MTRRTVSLLAGIPLGLMALWVGTAPVLGSGNSLLGGHEERWYLAFAYGTGYPVGCTVEGSCQYCAYTVWANCSAYYNGSHPCTGGSILIAVPDFEYNKTYANGLAGCSGSYPCGDLHHAYCALP